MKIFSLKLLPRLVCKRTDSRTPAAYKAKKLPMSASDGFWPGGSPGAADGLYPARESLYCPFSREGESREMSTAREWPIIIFILDPHKKTHTETTSNNKKKYILSERFILINNEISNLPFTTFRGKMGSKHVNGSKKILDKITHDCVLTYLKIEPIPNGDWG